MGLRELDRFRPWYIRLQLRLRLRDHTIRGEVMPRMYGLAWVDYCRDMAVCYPMPLNILMRWLYCVYGWCLRPPPMGTWLEQRDSKITQDAQLEAWADIDDRWRRMVERHRSISERLTRENERMRRLLG